MPITYRDYETNRLITVKTDADIMREKLAGPPARCYAEAAPEFHPACVMRLRAQCGTRPNGHDTSANVGDIRAVLAELERLTVEAVRAGLL